MKRYTKNNNGVYAFLESSGVLQNGTEDEIQKQKQLYWNCYKKMWKKQKKKQTKSFEILLTFPELKIVTIAAKKQHMSPTSYIRQSALNTNNHFLNPVTLGTIRELFYAHYNSLKAFIEINKLPPHLGDQFLEQSTKFERDVFKIITNNSDYQ